MYIPGLVSTLSFNVETGSAAFFCGFLSSSLLMLTFRAASAQARTLTFLFLWRERDTFSREECIEIVLEDSPKEESDR